MTVVVPWGEDSLGKLRGADQRALQVNVRVQKARQNDLTGYIHLHLPVVFAHAHDEPLGHGDIALAQLVGEDVDIGGVLQYQIGGYAAGGHIDHMELLVELPVDLAGIAFLSRHKNDPLSYRPVGVCSLELISVLLISHITTAYHNCP